MRYIVIAVALLSLAGPATAQQAAPHPPLPALGQMTADQAQAALGKPSYERRCADGSTTLAWKHRAEPIPLAVQAPRVETLVGKFAADGRPVWVREVH